MRRPLLAAALVAGAAALAVWAALPPARLSLARTWDDITVPGILHVHSNRSDGRGSPDDIALAAARAGLKFVVFTDHGDGTVKPDAPTYRRGVLCIDAVEISTTGGHYIALDMAPSSYPLGGEPRDVVDDVARLGGFGIAAHPDSPKADLEWRDWDLPFDGVELLNPDSGWRRALQDKGVRSLFTLGERFLAYPFRPMETVASFVSDSPRTRERWEHLLESRKVVAIAGADAHAKFALRSGEPGDTTWSLPIPGYQTSFQTMSVHVIPREPLKGDAVPDAQALIAGIREGHLYFSVDGLASRPAFTFLVASRTATTAMGDTLMTDAIRPDSPANFVIHTNAPPTFTTTLKQGSRAIATTHESSLLTRLTQLPAVPGVYHVEIRAGEGPESLLWLLSNPIYVRASQGGGSPQSSQSLRKGPGVSLFDGKDTSRWRVEQDSASSGVLQTAPEEGGYALRLQYTLSTNPSPRTFAALLTELPDGVGGNTALGFKAKAAAPMRISVQLRTGVSGVPEERWHRSVYVDQTERVITVPFAELTPIGQTRTAQPALRDIRYVLFVVDTTNTRPGSSGQLWIRDPALSR